eukprot:gene57733-biopygen32755
MRSANLEMRHRLKGDAKVCSRCNLSKPNDEFHDRQSNKGSDRVCLACTTQTKEERGTKKCSACGVIKPLKDFTYNQKQLGSDIRCIACTNRGDKRCKVCGLSKPNSAFALYQLHMGDDRRCKKCIDDKHSRNWTCAACGKDKQREEFAKSQLIKFWKKARCLDCLEGHCGRRGPKA